MSFPAHFEEFWFLLHARLSFLAGRRERARASLKSAIRRNPGSFFAHFMLGRLYWRDHVVVKAKREFDLAWQIDPERFERAYSRLREMPAGAPELFTYTDAEAGNVAEPVPIPLTILDESGVDESGRDDAGRDDSGFERSRTDDFVDENERARFDALPPITREEILEIDWEQLEAEISGE